MKKEDLIKFLKLSNSDEKSIRLYKHIGLSSVFKAGSAVIGLMLVPLSIRYLGKENYGLWLTIFSFLGWFSIVDFGIGNGLRNKLTEAFSNKNEELAKSYLSTAYYLMSIISIVAIGIFFVVHQTVDWQLVFNINPVDKNINRLMLIGFVIFSINLTLKNIVILYYADQRASFPELFNFLTQLLILASILMIMKWDNSNLFFYGTIVLGSQLTILSITTAVSFFGKYNFVRPRLKYFKKKNINKILGLGINFFIIQISATLLYATDNYIINMYLGPTEVTVFNVPYKYFMLIVSAMSIISVPYWSAFTEAYYNNDNIWLKESMKKLKRISFYFSLLTFLMIIVSKIIFQLWIGELVVIPFTLTLIMGLNVVIRIYLYPLIMFLNGTGKIKIELYLGVLLSLINIPLSIFFAHNLGYGVTGVILATLIVGLVEIVIFPIQVQKILNNKAKGLWNS